ncbi:serine/threonine-protein kinase [Kribbella sp. NPDC004875]|uniref:serine/threonine-protein kinase n=1 Tax=Kribbella sp. NPDC004875 TaxID=3364107 RepID=UPI0036BD5B42
MRTPEWFVADGVQRLVGGRYRLIDELGSGGFGRVWRARDETLAVDVAIKEIGLPDGLSERARADVLRRAEREARNAARLRAHPNVVGVHDILADRGTAWIVMQLVDGRSLADRLKAGGRLPIPEVRRIAEGLLDALEAAHAAGIVHRDVKPGNVLLGSDGDVQLADFGIAVHLADTTLTAVGTIMGSAQYAAPERLRGTDGLPASDLFSVGATLYEAVEGVAPFHRDTVQGTIAAVLMEDPPEPQHAGELGPLIDGLLLKDPDERPNLAAARRLLDSSATTSPVRTKKLPEAPPRKRPEPPRKRPEPPRKRPEPPRKRPEPPRQRAEPKGAKKQESSTTGGMLGLVLVVALIVAAVYFKPQLGGLFSSTAPANAERMVTASKGDCAGKADTNEADNYRVVPCWYGAADRRVISVQDASNSEMVDGAAERTCSDGTDTGTKYTVASGSGWRILCLATK